jgi:peptidyl-prolyl cis-trans isomerase B (cyclophilin B)
MESIMIEFKTSRGDFTVELFADKAPETVKNFLAYVDAGFYDGTIFHRVIENFMIQGGGFTPQFQQKTTGSPIPNEAANGLKNKKGTLAMARTNDPHSATAQFFINVVDNAFLDFKNPNPQQFGYCVFGQVVKGLETVDKIKAVQTGNQGCHQNVPIEPVTILSAKRVQAT